jgi:hypothetical protein
MQGTVVKTGSDNFKGTISKILKGEFEDAIVGQSKIEGFCRNGMLQAKTFAASGNSFGELDLTREKK